MRFESWRKNDRRAVPASGSAMAICESLTPGRARQLSVEVWSVSERSRRPEGGHGIGSARVPFCSIDNELRQTEAPRAANLCRINQK